MAKLYSIVSEQFPEFVRNQYPIFVEFIRSYYKWMEQNYPSNYSELIDIDETAEEYVKYFKSSLDVDGILDSLFDNRYVKHIKQIYSSKGSEQSLVRILEIVYDADIVVEYPGEHVLRASDGRWDQQSFITVETVYGQLPDKVISFFIGTTHIFASDVVPISDNKVRLFFQKRTDVGSIEVDQYVEIKNGAVHYIGKVVKSPARVDIIDGGLNWQLGQLFVIPGSISNSIGKVTQIDTAGKVLSAVIYEFGDGHTEDQIVEVYPNNQNITIEKLTASYRYGVVSEFEGNWKEDFGKISNDVIRLQDNYYYQQFSYVIDSDINSALYIDMAKAINPAGLKLFTNYNIQSSIVNNITGNTTFPFRHLFFGPEYINVLSAIAKNVTKPFSEQINTTDLMSINILKPFVETISFSGHTDNIQQTSGDYALEDYFAENYNKSVINITINTSI